jgi:hypothetical protein
MRTPQVVRAFDPPGFEVTCTCAGVAAHELCVALSDCGRRLHVSGACRRPEVAEMWGLGSGFDRTVHLPRRCTAAPLPAQVTLDGRLFVRLEDA